MTQWYIVGKNILFNKELTSELVRSFTGSDTITICVCDPKKWTISKLDKLENEFSASLLPGKKINLTNIYPITQASPALSNFDIFYFPRKGALVYFQEKLKENKLTEPSYKLIGEEFSAPTSIVVKSKNSYFKLITLERSRDGSFICRFNGNYVVSDYIKSKTIPSKINLKEKTLQVHNPHITYHPSGVVHSKDESGKTFISDLTTAKLSPSRTKPVGFPFLAVTFPRNHKYYFKDIGSPPLDTDLINLTEVSGSKINIVKQGLNKPSFIVVSERASLTKKESLTVEFWIHDAIPGNSGLPFLSELQRKNIFNALTMNNSLSEISYTIIFRKVSFEKGNGYRPICVVFNNDSFNIFQLRKIDN